jgi:hypothetical protein
MKYIIFTLILICSTFCFSQNKLKYQHIYPKSYLIGSDDGWSTIEIRIYEKHITIKIDGKYSEYVITKIEEFGVKWSDLVHVKAKAKDGTSISYWCYGTDTIPRELKGGGFLVFHSSLGHEMYRYGLHL